MALQLAAAQETLASATALLQPRTMAATQQHQAPPTSGFHQYHHRIGTQQQQQQLFDSGRESSGEGGGSSAGSRFTRAQSFDAASAGLMPMLPPSMSAVTGNTPQQLAALMALLQGVGVGSISGLSDSQKHDLQVCMHVCVCLRARAHARAVC